MTAWPDLSVEARNRRFLDAQEFFDDVIQDRKVMRMSPWRQGLNIPRAAFELGDGIEKSAYRFHPGLAEQRGLQRWEAIQVSKPASGNDPGYDACEDNPYTLDYGFEVIAYSGIKTARATPPICIRDIRFTWQFMQQLELIMNFLADYRLDVDENFHREQYLNFCNANSKIYALGGGAPNTYVCTYNPFSVDGDGDNILRIPKTQLSALNWKPMRWLSRYFQNQVPMAGSGSEGNGRPVYPLVLDLEDFDEMIERDPQLREDFRFGRPEVNIQNYGSVEQYKGFSFLHDFVAPRFALKSEDATYFYYKRVNPYIESNTNVTGTRWDVNPAYLNAPVAMAIPLLKNVFQVEVPPAGPASPGGGTSFGSTPGLNGEWRWLNIQDIKENRLNEKGFYYSRCEYFPKPLDYDDEATAVVYLRCVTPTIASCDTGGSAALGSPASAVAVSGAYAAAVTGSTVLVSVKMAGVIDRDVTQQVSLKVDGGTSYTAWVADAVGAPTYIFLCDSASDATAVIAAASSIEVSWT